MYNVLRRYTGSGKKPDIIYNIIVLIPPPQDRKKIYGFREQTRYNL